MITCFAVKTKDGYRVVEAVDLDDCRRHVGKGAEIRQARITIEELHDASYDVKLRRQIFKKSKKLKGGGGEREPIPAQLRFDILSRDLFTCQACNAQPGNDRLHVDHLLPWSLGGSNHPLNLTTLCDRCNLGKGPRIFVPPRLLLSPQKDKQGFQIWKQFGAWNIEVCDNGIIVNCPSQGGYVWFGVERSHEMDWMEHFEGKRWFCEPDEDDDKEAGIVLVDLSKPLPPRKPRHPRLDMEMGLSDALEFARAIYRNDEAPR